MNPPRVSAETQELAGWPALRRGDLYLGYYLGWLGRMIALFQGLPGAVLSPPWSHSAVYVGDGMLAEATYPKGRLFPLSGYADASHVFSLFRVREWTEEQADAVARKAEDLVGRPYDSLNLFRHLVDNGIERLTWNPRRQKGYRPLASLIGDGDRDRRLVCSELVERAVLAATGEEVNPGHKIGEARPLDLFQWLEAKEAALVLRVDRGYVGRP